MSMVSTAPTRQLRVIGLVLAALLCVNPLVDRMGLKYWLVRGDWPDLAPYAYRGIDGPVDVLVVGSSRMALAVSPVWVRETVAAEGGRELVIVNLSQIGGNAVSSSIVLRDAVRAGGCPGLVLFGLTVGAVNVNSMTLEKTLRVHVSLIDTLRLLPEVDRWSRVDAALAGTLRGYANLYSLVTQPPFGRRAQLAELRGRGSSFFDARHLAREPVRFARLPEGERQEVEAQSAALYQDLLRDYEIAGAPVRYLRRTLELAGRCDSDLVFVRPPASGVLDSWIGDRRRSTFMDLAASLAAGPDVDFYAPDAAAAGLDGDDFENPGHLNIEGAYKFSALLARSVVLPRIEPRESRTSR